MLLTKKQRKKSPENNTPSPYREQGNNIDNAKYRDINGCIYGKVYQVVFWGIAASTTMMGRCRACKGQMQPQTTKMFTRLKKKRGVKEVKVKQRPHENFFVACCKVTKHGTAVEKI